LSILIDGVNDLIRGKIGSKNMNKRDAKNFRATKGSYLRAIDCKTSSDNSGLVAIDCSKGVLDGSNNTTLSLVKYPMANTHADSPHGAIFINASGNRFQAACGFHQGTGTELRAAMYFFRRACSLIMWSAQGTPSN
jgi:hypothetical protein